MKRESWDHGTHAQAIEFLLYHRQAPGEEYEFLKAWNEGDLDEWPEFYEWLDTQTKLGEDDLVFRLRKRAEIRRQIPNRKSVQQGEPDRIADLLEEAANRIDELNV